MPRGRGQWGRGGREVVVHKHQVVQSPLHVQHQHAPRDRHHSPGPWGTRSGATSNCSGSQASRWLQQRRRRGSTAIGTLPSSPGVWSVTRSLAISIRTCWPWKAGDDLHHSSRDLCTCDFQPEGLERDSDHVGRLEGGESQHQSEDGGHTSGD